MSATTYELTEGTQPSEDVQHEPRTLQQVRNGEVVMMMTEIEDGIFVGWDLCGTCGKYVTRCHCSNGPQPSAHLKSWRDARFVNSIRHRRPVEDVTEASAADDAAPAAPENTTTREDFPDVGF